MEYLTFRKYKSLEEASVLIDILKSSNVDYQTDNVEATFDITFTGGTELEDKVAIKIKSSDFEKVDQLLENTASKSMNLIDEDHYLYEFTDEELLEVLEEYDKWNKLDYLLAQNILKSRGKEYSKDEIHRLREKRIEELSRPEKGHNGWLIFGYIFAFMGGLLGIFIGHHLYRFKKRLPTGERVYAYDAVQLEELDFESFTLGFSFQFYGFLYG